MGTGSVGIGLFAVLLFTRPAGADPRLQKCAVKATAAAEICTMGKTGTAPSPINNQYYRYDTAEAERVEQTLDRLDTEQARIAGGLQARLGANATCSKVKGVDGDVAAFNSGFAQICGRFISECRKFCMVGSTDPEFMRFNSYRHACGRLEANRQNAVLSMKNSLVHSLSAGMCKIDSQGNVILANDFQRGVGEFVDKHGGTIVMGAAVIGGGYLLGSHLSKRNRPRSSPALSAPAAPVRQLQVAEPTLRDRVNGLLAQGRYDDVRAILRTDKTISPQDRNAIESQLKALLVQRVNPGSADTVAVDPRLKARDDVRFFQSEGMYEAAESTIKSMISSGDLSTASQEIKRLQQSGDLAASDTGHRLQAELDRKLEAMGYPAGDLGLQMMGGN